MSLQFSTKFWTRSLRTQPCIRLPANISQQLVPMTLDYTELTEVSGDDVTREQVERMARRYYWAGEYCCGRDVLEVACGAGQGVGYIGSLATSVRASDISEPLLSVARGHYGDRFVFGQFDALEMPFEADRFDVVLLFEALYYLPDVDGFFDECHRVLRPGGHLLIATANKDLFDFNPSPHSHRYLGVSELSKELSARGFDVTVFGDTPVATVGLRQRVLSPVKAAASRLGLIPNSMRAKKLLKKLAFGALIPMPAEIDVDTAPKLPPQALAADQSDQQHKVIFCAARMAD